jgi:diphthine-ammonia ligase
MVAGTFPGKVPATFRAAVSWSGGKDSCTALHRVHEQYDVVSMVTMFDEEGTRSRSHGLRPEILQAHATLLGVKLVTRRCSWPTYTASFVDALRELREDDITHVIFGDIMFDAHRHWAEDVCAQAGLIAVEPIWGEPTSAMLREFLEIGGEAIIVTARAGFLDSTWLGRPLTLDMLIDLPGIGVDPCGEHGEYHTLVTNSPLFERPLQIRRTGHLLKSGCWALDVELADTTTPVAGGFGAARD